MMMMLDPKDDSLLFIVRARLNENVRERERETTNGSHRVICIRVMLSEKRCLWILLKKKKKIKRLGFFFFIFFYAWLYNQKKNTLYRCFFLFFVVQQCHRSLVKLYYKYHAIYLCDRDTAMFYLSFYLYNEITIKKKKKMKRKGMKECYTDVERDCCTKKVSCKCVGKLRYLFFIAFEKTNLSWKKKK